MFCVVCFFIVCFSIAFIRMISMLSEFYRTGWNVLYANIKGAILLSIRISLSLNFYSVSKCASADELKIVDVVACDQTLC